MSVAGKMGAVLGKEVAKILKPLQKNVKFKKKYDIDLGKESATERSIRDVRADKGRGGARAADAGSDPIVIGKKSMATFAEGLGNAPLSRIKNKLEKLGEEIPAAKTAFDKLEELDADRESSRQLKSQIGKTGGKKIPDGIYVNKKTGEVFNINKLDIRVKKLPGSINDYFRNPTKEELNKVSRNIAARRNLKKTGEDMESTIKRLQLQLVAKINRTKGKDRGSKIGLNKGGAITKSNKGSQDFRNGGMVLSTVDRRKKRG